MPVDLQDIYAPGNSVTKLAQRAALLLDAGEVVVLPTETVYGAAGRLDRPVAVERLRALRGAQAAGPFTIHLASPQDAEPYVGVSLSPLGRRMTQKLWPGPVALQFPVDAETRSAVAGRLGLADGDLFDADGSITLRCPDQPVATLTLAGVRGPVALSRVETRAGDHPFDDDVVRGLDGVASLVIDAGRTRFSKPSTIVRVEEDTYRVLREGIFDQRIIERQLRTVVLFICSGNTCRSPMASALAAKALKKKYAVADDAALERQGIVVMSAGTFAMPGLRATPQAADAVAGLGGDLSGHRSRPLTHELVNAADFIFTMGRGHAQAIVAAHPSAAARVLPFDPSGDVEDPIGGELPLYRELAERFETLVEARLEETVLKLHPPANGRPSGPTPTHPPEEQP